MFEHRELDAVAALLHLAPTSPDSLRPGLALLHGWIRMPTRYTSSADTHAMVARIAPSISSCSRTAYRAAGEPSLPPWPIAIPRKRSSLPSCAWLLPARYWLPAASTPYRRPPSRSRAKLRTCFKACSRPAT